MDELNLPPWLRALNSSEIDFVKNFILHSGSLKAMAEIYELSYPTLRLRLDRLIDKITGAEEESQDEFENLLKDLTFTQKIDVASAQALLTLYERDRKKK